MLGYSCSSFFYEVNFLSLFIWKSQSQWRKIWAWPSNSALDWRRCSFLDFKDLNSFVVVRHPWDRFTSEYTRKASTGCKRFINHRNLSFEQYCLKFLRISRNKFHARDGFVGMTHFQSCHFLPQYFYVGTSRESHFSFIPKVIRIQEINSQLPKLVSTDLSEKLERLLNSCNKNSHRTVVSDAIQQSIKQVSPELKTKIQNFYSQDFQLLGFILPTNLLDKR